MHVLEIERQLCCEINATDFGYMKYTNFSYNSCCLELIPNYYILLLLFLQYSIDQANN